MSSGLLALLDDIAAIAKVTAASLDDVAAQAVKASSKAAGVVIDDTAVTPKYVVGLSPERELPIVWKIAKGSLRNKLLILLPVLLLLGALAPWAVGPLLAIGGLFLCYEGYEKLHHALFSRFHEATDNPSSQEPIAISPEQLEAERTGGAIRTDFILSAEIMAIAYNEVQKQSIWLVVSSMLAVAVVITAGVYGIVALILKADDLGLRLSKGDRSESIKGLGRFLIRSMPALLKFLSAVGTTAMLWVGGGIIIHSISPLHHWQKQWLEKLGESGFVTWILEAILGLLLAVFIGFLLVQLIQRIPRRRLNLSQ